MPNKSMPNLNEEKKLWRKGYKYVAGLDEAGRGPLAGPVVASAVVITIAKIKIKNTIQNSQNSLKEVRDSKKLSPKKREELYKIITKHPDIKLGIGKVSEKVIDKINILEATKLAMKKAVNNLNRKLKNENCEVDFLILDGNFTLPAEALARAGVSSFVPQKSIIKADEKVFSCAAASIIAKVERDRLMEKQDKKYPGYGFNRHKGYPTKSHKKMLKKYGPCPIHRRSFRPLSRVSRPVDNLF